MKEIQGLEAQREARELRRRNAREVRDTLVAFPELWNNLDDDERRRLLQLTIERLVLEGPSETAVLKTKRTSCASGSIASMTCIATHSPLWSCRRG